MKRDIALEESIVEKSALTVPILDDRARRLLEVNEPHTIGYGVDTLLSMSIDLARNTKQNSR